MTNGRTMQAMFPSMKFAFIEGSLVGVYIIENQSSPFVFSVDWWNAEYKEPATKNGISNKSIIYKAKESKEIQEDLDKLSKLNEPTTKDDLGVDCIKKSDAINIIQDMHGLARADVISDAVNRIITMSSVTLQESKWIPVSERLPKKNVEVLATTIWGAVTIAEMFSANDWLIHEGATNAGADDIVAWMPLPREYREVEE